MSLRERSHEHSAEELAQLSIKWERLLLRSNIGAEVKVLPPDQPDYFGLSEDLRDKQSPILDDLTEEPITIDDVQPLLRIMTPPQYSHTLREAYAHLGARVTSSVILPVIPAPSIIEAWEQSTSRGTLDEHPFDTVERRLETRELYMAIENAAFSLLDDREAEMIALRFGLERPDPQSAVEYMELEAIGELFGGLSKERVRQILIVAISKLRNPKASPLSAYMPQQCDEPDTVAAGIKPESRAPLTVRELLHMHTKFADIAIPLTRVVGNILGVTHRAETPQEREDYLLDSIMHAVGMGLRARHVYNLTGELHLASARELLKMVNTAVSVNMSQPVADHLTALRRYVETYRVAVDKRYQDEAWLEREVSRRFIEPFLSSSILFEARRRRDDVYGYRSF